MPDPVVNKNAARFIPVAKPSITSAERLAVAKVMESGWLSSGENVVEFEHEFAAAHGKSFGVACNSGTTALQLSLMVADVNREAVSKGVLCPTMTMVAVPNAILSAGSHPVFVDSEPLTGNMRLFDGDKLTPSFEIIPHLYGVPVEFHRSNDIVAIEDAAEAHYATFADGSPVGSRGDLACFSFFANKIITSGGEGGMVLTNDAAVAGRLRGLRAHAFTAGEHFHHIEHAHGCRMTEIQAAVGLAQHRRRHEILKHRREIGERYAAALSQIPWVQLQQRTPGSAWWVMPLLVRDGYGLTRDRVRGQLAAAGIETRTWFKPMAQQPHLARFAAGQRFPVADDLYRRGLYLPIFYDMTDGDVDYVIEQLASLQP